APISVFLLLLHRPPRPPLFPYTTLFRSFSTASSTSSVSSSMMNAPWFGFSFFARPHSRLMISWIAIARRTESSVGDGDPADHQRSEEHTSELQSRGHLVCRLLLEKKKKK